MLSFTLGKNSISLMIDGEFNTIPNSAANFSALNDELKKPADQRDESLIKSLVTTKKMLEAFSFGKVKITEDERVIYDGKEITNYLGLRMLQILNEGHNVTPFACFMERVHANPNAYTHDELYEWMEAADLPLTADGFLIAFKKVKKNYTDCHTGMFDNSVGAVLEMDRKSCDTNRNNDCSTGFHFCSAGYLSNFNGDRVMVLKIDPADVTAIPKDYNRTKGRTCRYVVIGELSEQSEAYKAAWKRGVVKFDDTQELPEVGFQSRPKLKQIVIGDAREIAKLMGAKTPIAAKVAATATPKPAAVKKAPAPTLVVMPKAAAPVAGEQTFKLKDGRVFTASEVKAALVKNNGGLRPTARDLGIQDSSLRGWVSKL